MKKWWLLVSILVVVMSFSVYSKDCFDCSDDKESVVKYTCPDSGLYSNCALCLSFGKNGPVSVDSTCGSCQKCGLSNECKDECNTNQVCVNDDCCKPDGGSCWTDGSCCSGNCKGSKCISSSCTPDCAGKCGGADDGCGGKCNADCPSGQTCESKVCAACSGCISGGNCHPGTDNVRCGSGGGSCSACGINKHCDNGNCVADSVQCNDDCSTSGSKQCSSPGGYQTCGNYDSDSCLEWSSITACSYGQTCSSGSCAACPSVCSNGDVRCQQGDNRYYQTCVVDNYGCLVWGASTSCPSGQTCSGSGVCSSSPSCKSNNAACSSNSECCSGYCSGTCKTLSGGTASYAITNKKSVYDIGDTITSTWSLPSYAYEDAPCTVWFYVNGVPDNVGWAGYVTCGDPGLDGNGDTGTLSTAHCYGKSTVTTNSVQIIIKDSAGATIIQSGSDSYTIDCSPSTPTCKNNGEICAKSTDCCSGLSCFQTYESYQRVYKCMPASTGCNAYNFISGSTTPSSGAIGDKFTIKCDYGAKIDCIYPWSTVAGGSCLYTGFEGTAAVFDCKAQYSGNNINYCHLNENTNDDCCASYDAAGSINTGEGYRCTCQASGCGWEKCTAADVGKTMCKVAWTWMGPHYNEVRKCTYSEEDGCYLYLPVEDCSKKANAGCALNTVTNKHECICSTPCTANEKKCVETVKWVSPAPPGDWMIQQCNANGCGWKELKYCGYDEECDQTTKDCKTKPCPYCCPSGKTCSSPSGGTGCTQGTCCSSESACALSTCPNGICSTGENCALDSSSCTNNKCYTPTCTSGCGQAAVANGLTDEACYSNTGCTGGNCKCNGAGQCVSTSAPSCNDGICSSGENCPQDNVSCSNNKCYNPTCTSGCGQAAVANGLTDEACYGSVGCGNSSGDLVHKGRISDDATTFLKSSVGVFVSGNYAYVASVNDHGIEVVDVSNPSNPIHKGKVSVTSPWKLFVSGNYTYVISLYLPNGVGLSVVDVSNPALPSLKSVVYDDATTLLNGTSDVFVSGNYVYVISGMYGGDKGLEIVDVSNPASPVHKGRLVDDSTTLLENPTGIFVSGNYAYITNNGVWGPTGQITNQPGLEIVDISNPASPVHKGKLVDDSNTFLEGPADVFVSGSYAYIPSVSGLNKGLEVVDVSNPASPVHKGKFVDDAISIIEIPNSIVVSGNYAYISNWMFPGGIEVVDISNPASPVHKSKVVDSHTAWLEGLKEVFVSGNYLYSVSWINDSLEIFEIPGGSDSNCKCDGSGQCVSGGGTPATCKKAGSSCSLSTECCSNLQCTTHQQCSPPGSNCCMPTAAACSETDGGANYNVKGNTTGYSACTVQSNCPDPYTGYDGCGNSSLLVEMVCWNGFVSSDVHHCPDGCSDGKCGSAQVVTTLGAVSVSDFRAALVYSISSYFSSSPVLTADETKDLIDAYFSSSGNSVGLSGTGPYSGKSLQEIYDKAKDSSASAGTECVYSTECTKCGDSCIPYSQWTSYCGNPTTEFDCSCNNGVCEKV